MIVLNWSYRFSCMQPSSSTADGEFTGQRSSNLMMSIGDNNRTSTNKGMGKRSGKRPGRKPSKIDERAKLERSRQSARECRARKKLRYQYLEELVLNREKAVFALRDELETYKQWSFILEHGGQLPDSLLKMLANDDVSMRRRQIDQVKRSLLQDQLSSSSSACSASPDVSPSPQLDQTKLQHPRISTIQHQSGSSQFLNLHTYPSDNSAAKNLQQQQYQEAEQAKEALSPARFQRQLAFDHSHHHQNDLTDLQLSSAQNPSVPQTQAQNVGSQPNFGNELQPQQEQQQQLLLNQQRPNQERINNNNKIFPLPQIKNVQMATNSWKSQDFSLFNVKNDSPVNYNQTFEEFSQLQKIGQDNSQIPQGASLHGAGQPPRRRSLSNPASMTSHSRQHTHASSSHDLPSSLQDFITSHNSSGPHINQHGPYLGLFTGSLIGGTPNFSPSRIHTAITVDDSSSSDEAMDETCVTQSSVISQKREHVFPVFSENSKRNEMSVNTVSLNSVRSNFDLQSKNTNQSNVDCFDVKNTTKASISSLCGLTTSVSLPTPSIRFGGVSTSGPSSSSINSPIPLSSLTSFFELYAASPGLPSSAYEITSTSTSNNNVPSHITSAGINSFIHEPVPDWYSFLDDLQDGTNPTLTPRHVTSNNNTASTTLTSKQNDQVLTHNSSFMNVPNIIDEILDSSDQIL